MADENAPQEQEQERPKTAFEELQERLQEIEERPEAYGPLTRIRAEREGVPLPADLPAPQTPFHRTLTERAEATRQGTQGPAFDYDIFRDTAREADPIGPPPPTSPGQRTGPVNYLESDAPPAGWNPRPDEISRLVDANLLRANEAGNLDRVWAAGRADAAKRGGLGWVDTALGEELITDVQRGESAVQAALWTQVPVSHIRGVPVINTYEMNRQAQDLWYSKILEEKDITPRTATAEQIQEARNEASRRAARTMARVMQTGGRRFWADPLDHDITDDIMESNKLWRMFRALSSPASYGAVGVGTPDTDLDAVARSQLILSGQQLKYESPISLFGRFAPSTLLSAAVSTGTAPWSRESVEAVRAGEDIVLHIGDVADWMSGAEEGEAPTWAKAASGLTTLGVILVEPDLFSLAGIPMGKGSKLVKATRTSNRMRRAVAGADTVRDALRAGNISVPEAASQLEALDAAVARAVELNAGAQLRVGGVVNEELERTYKTVEGLRERATTLRAEADEARAAYQGAEGEAAALRLTAQAAEQEHAGAVLGALAAESEKNAYLMSQGLSWEAANRVTSRGSIPTHTRAAREAKRMAKDLEKKANALRREHRDALNTYQKKANTFGQVLQHLTEGFRAVPEATTRRGALRAEWDVLAREGKKEGLRAPTIGQEVSFRTEAGGFSRGIVEDIQVRGPKGGRLSGRPPKTAPKEGYQLVVTVKTRDGVKEIIHPYRIGDHATARATNVARDEFLEWHNVVARADGPLEQITVFQRGAEDARATAKALAEGGPAARAVTNYEEAMGVLRVAQDEAKTTAKSAKTATRSEEDLLNKWVGRSVAQTKTELKAASRARIRDVYSNAVDEVARGLDAFRGEGLEKLGMVAARGPLGAMKNLRAAGRLSREDIARWGQEVSDEVVEDAYREVAGKSFKLEGEARTATVDAPQLLADLEKVAGREFVEEYLKAGKATSLSKAVEDAATSGAPITRSFEETAPLMGEVRELIRAGEANRLYQDATRWGRAIFEGWNDLNLVRTKGGRLTLWGDRLKRRVRTAGRQGNNIAVRMGEMNQELEAVVTEVERLFSRAQLELMEVGHAKHLGGTPEARFITFLDATENLGLKEGMTRWLSATGNGSAYQKGALQMLADTRLDPRLAAKREVAIKQNRRRINAIVDERLGKPLVMDGVRIPRKEIDELLEGLDDDLLALMAKGENVVDGVPKALVAVSRMWLPSYALKAFTQEEGIILLGIARGALQKAKTYGEFSQRMRRGTYAILGKTASNAPKAHASGATGFMLAATLGEYGHRVERVLGASVDVDQARDINRILTGNFDEIEDLDTAMDGLGRLGMPFTQKEILAHRGVADGFKSIGKKSRELVELGTKKGGSSFVPKVLIDEIEQRAGRIAKDLEALHDAGRTTSFAGSAARMHLNLWRSSAVTGLGLPNPRYWTNNIFGDFSQLWMEEGLGFAARRSFINFPTNIPFFGRALQLKSLYLAEKAAGRSGRADALPGMMETMLNPHLGQVFKGEVGQFVTKNGDVVSYDQLRLWALEDGISEAFVREELLELYSKVGESFSNQAKELGQWWQRQIGDHASLVQERQRVGMYADLIQRGIPRAEAAKRTKRALYDWSHGIAEWEAKTIARIIPFWRFWRLSLKQTADAFMEPLVRPSGEVFKKAMVGNTKLARLRQQLYIWPSLPDFIYQKDINVGMTTEEKVNLLARELYPDWQETRAKVGVLPIDPARRQYYMEMYGREYTHESLMLPTVTATDSFDMLFALTSGLGILTSKVVEHIPGADRFLPGLQLVGDHEARFFEPLLSSAHPAFETPIRSALSWMGADLDYTVQGSRRFLGPTDEDAFRLLPWTRSQMQYDKDRGQWWVPSGVYLNWRMLPIASTQMSGWVGAAKNPEWDNGFFAGSTMMLRKLTRFGDPRPFNMNDSLRGRIMDIQKEWNEVKQEFGDVRKADRSMRTRGRRE